MKTAIISYIILYIVTVSVSAQTTDDNYTMVFKASVPKAGDLSHVNNPVKVLETVTYYDGLGREIQTTGSAASPLGKDVIKLLMYDQYGKTSRSYLQYSTSRGDGSVRVTDATEQTKFYQGFFGIEDAASAFTEQLFEHSELGRPQVESAPGAAWCIKSGRVLRKEYLSNTDGEVRLFSYDPSTLAIRPAVEFYPKHKLQCVRTTDEDGNDVMEYLDDEGRTVCKKMKVSSEIYAATYYVYDETGNLVIVIPPEGVNDSSARERWYFQYRYDGRKRMTHKKIPEADWIFMVYDDRDRLAMTQDGEQRKSNQWTFMKYDALNRLTTTGLYTHDRLLEHSEMSMLVKSDELSGTFEPLIMRHYDNYDFLDGDDQFSYKWIGLKNQYEHTPGSHMPLPKVIGQITGVWTRVLGKDKQWLRTVNYYDDKYRLVQTISDNHNRGRDILTKVYDFSGNPVVTKSESVDHRIVWESRHPSVWVASDRLKSLAGTMVYAFSSQQIPSDVDGWVEFTCSSDMTVNSSRSFGFSTGAPNEIGFGVKQTISTGQPAESYLQVIESGKQKGPTVAVQGGDIVRVERTGTTIHYSKNGSRFFSTTVNARPALSAHAILHQLNAELFNPRISFPGSTRSIERKFEYDHAGRLLKTLLSLDGAEPITLSKRDYNELGQLIDKKLHSLDGKSFQQSVDYRYNIRGWMTSINGSQLIIDPDKNPDTRNERRDLFGLDLLYNDVVPVLDNVACFNGNISAVMWNNNSGPNDTKKRAYRFNYDPMNRLIGATHSLFKTTWLPSNAFHESGITYDLNGNIKTLTRTGRQGITIDRLDYSYGENDNRLTRVTDSGTIEGFTEGANLNDDYAYDSNGNLTIDRNKKIATIVYNHLNLPSKVVKTNGEYLINTYDANGRKLSQQLFSASHVQVERRDYQGEWLYEDDTLRLVNHEEGRALPDGNWVPAKQLLPYPDMTPKESYSANLNSNIVMTNEVTNKNTYLKIISNQSTSTPGFLSGFVNVMPGRRYTLKVKGYRTSAAPVALYVLGNGISSGDVLWPGATIPVGSDAEAWVESTFLVPQSMNLIRVGLLWQKSVKAGDSFFIDKMELYEYNGTHGNMVFSQSGYEYQYHLKDHLGNVRLTFTTKQDTQTSKATAETENAFVESGEFLNYSSMRRINHPVYDHTYDGLIPPNKSAYAIRLNGSSKEKIGLAKSLSVMPGDTLKTEVFAKYYEPPVAGNPGILASLMASIIGGAAPMGTFVDGAGYGNGSTATLPLLTLPGKLSEKSGPPKAYLNWLIFDKDYNIVLSQSNYKRIGVEAREDTTDIPHQRLAPDEDLVIGQPGYAYIYLSNENDTPVEVYFDDFTVKHIKSPVVQSQDYYPFGLTFNSFNRENTTYDRYLYNGRERQEELGVGWLDYGARMYMPELGRWSAVDPMSEQYFSFSPYDYVRNNPVARLDVGGNWDITVHLFNDRTKYGYGVAIVTDRKGNEVFRFNVRAQGVGGTDRMNTYADTPLGVYDIPDDNMWKAGETSGELRKSYGPNPRLILVEESGEILESGRDKIRIHGGRQEVYDGNTKEWKRDEALILEKTKGCLRAFDSDMTKLKEITDELAKNDSEEHGGKVTIVDDLKEERSPNPTGTPGYALIYALMGNTTSLMVTDPISIAALLKLLTHK